MRPPVGWLRAHQICAQLDLRRLSVQRKRQAAADASAAAGARAAQTQSQAVAKSRRRRSQLSVRRAAKL